MSELIPFEYEGNSIRVVEIDGDPWFVAPDVAKVLNYRSAPDMTRRIEDDEKGYAKVRTPGGDQEVTVLSESGLYDAIFRSNAEGAKPFRRWVTSEVLPTIRKTGSYGAASAPALTGPALYLAAIEQATNEIAALEEENRVLTPKAEAFDGFLGATGDYSLNEGAKLLARNGVKDMGQNRLRDHLLRWGWLYRGRKERLRAHQSAIDTGRMCERTSWYYDDHTGERKTGQTQAVITAKGLFDVKKKLSGEQGFLVTADDNPAGGAA